MGVLADHLEVTGADKAWNVYRSIAGSAFQAARSLLPEPSRSRIGCLGEGSHADPPRPCLDHSVDVVQRDPANGEPGLRLDHGDWRFPGGIADQVEANRLVVRLGGRGVDGSDAEIVDITVLDRLVDLTRRMGGSAKQRPGCRYLRARADEPSA